ncbi:hypothetical protein [Sporosarcina pasteurii]|uniref:Uncharacterized protein n=1 Tax=Sporosarcina pasteurii TaxID=1474 RepID=A0A380BEU9_SPOPA|nr:hypothetical protein [Sporosarcina pasteurii]MDS9472198.1 hypothetical protein [Sporosarcina pasteurii]QBQ06186.1 hypothetical protein E2C16_11145 [Sporosarcina pasteurii]SUI99209.1 Uncharacterised protein [Sporosarcina pasteurii]
MNQCEWCGTGEAKIHLTGETSSNVCNHCYNALMSEELGIEVEQLMESFTMKDDEGNLRTFHVEMRIQPIGICLEAKENKGLGYQFAIHGELDDSQSDLLKRLIEKVRNGIQEKQIETGTFQNGQVFHSMIHDQVVGRVEFDEASDGLPLVIIDGKPYTWEEVGKMLMTYEGFQFKLKMYDMTDDVD